MEIKFVCPNCRVLQGGNLRSLVPFDESQATAFVTCNYCNRGAVIFVVNLKIRKEHAGSDLISNFPWQEAQQLDLRNVHPLPPRPREVPNLPENVRRAYLDGEEHLATRHYRSAVAAYRTSLERSLRNLDTEDAASKGTLFKKIEAFAKKYSIPEALIQLMHSVRDFGNDIHEDVDPTEDEAKLAAECATLLLIYIFDLPARVEAVKARKQRVVE
ncbi:DUF4145 domain-containing protein [Paracoccus sp. KR1-242]|uniref:DUF4145 domain-containing protein n=1 Tax=Paracoccus sp. KR1-242 TaxID=3410028 RepID=UPI003C05C523